MVIFQDKLFKRMEVTEVLCEWIMQQDEPRDWFVIYPATVAGGQFEVIGLAFNDRPFNAVVH